MSKIKVDTIEGSTGTTITVPSGQTLTVTDGIPATNLSGTIADARLPTVPVTKGGTGLTSLGSANQQVRVNSAGNALEFATIAAPSSDYVKLASSTASNAANVSFDGYFSNTYTRYIIYGNQIYSAHSNADIYFRVNTGGSADSGNHYVQTSHYQYTDNTPSHIVGQAGVSVGGSLDLNSEGTLWELNGDNFSNVATRPANMLLEIHDPSNASNFKIAKFEVTYIRSDGQTFQRIHGNGVFKDTTAVTGITIYTNGGNIYGNFALYGIK